MDTLNNLNNSRLGNPSAVVVSTDNARQQQSGGANTQDLGIVDSASGNNLPTQQAVSNQSAEQANPSFSFAEAQQIAEQLTELAQNVQRDLSFSVDDVTGVTVITVKAASNDEVIRQIPSEEALQLVQNLQSLQDELAQSSGNLIETQV